MDLARFSQSAALETLALPGCNTSTTCKEQIDYENDK
tara:strand:- start:333 stop:443 length:111 start_codon:yes stop_codon:yes gene_type:complete